jgi:hypothetical protein
MNYSYLLDGVFHPIPESLKTNEEVADFLSPYEVKAVPVLVKVNSSAYGCFHYPEVLTQDDFDLLKRLNLVWLKVHVRTTKENLVKFVELLNEGITLEVDFENEAMFRKVTKLCLDVAFMKGMNHVYPNITYFETGGNIFEDTKAFPNVTHIKMGFEDVYWSSGDDNLDFLPSYPKLQVLEVPSTNDYESFGELHRHGVRQLIVGETSGFCELKFDGDGDVESFEENPDLIAELFAEFPDFDLIVGGKHINPKFQTLFGLTK